MRKHDTESQVIAFVAVFLTIIGFIIALFIRRDDRYVMYYAKHGLVLFIFQVIIAFVTSIAFFNFFTIPLWIVFLIAWIWCWINALSGETRPTPLVTHFAEKIDF